MKYFVNAGCSPTAYNAKGKTVLEAAFEREYASVVEHLLSCNDPVPPNILPIALRRCLTPEIIQSLLRKGADVHSTESNGDTVLHLAIAIAGYLESECLDLVKSFINAGCSPTACNSAGKTVLEAAVEATYTSVVEHLLSCNVPVPPHILPVALRGCCSPQMIELLVRTAANGAAIVSLFRWETLLWPVYALYSGQDCQQVIEILDAARKAETARPSVRDETPIHVGKRPRLV